MRTLRFKVNGQILSLDSECDATGLVPGTESYLKAEFEFSKEWNGYVKVASFSSALGEEFEPQMLRDGMSCTIPSEALNRRKFKIMVMGKKGNSKLVTNKLEIKQEGDRQ